MTNDDLQAIHQELTGGDGTIAWPKFLVAIKAFAGWPVDAFAIGAPQGELTSLYWIRGNLLGRLDADGDSDDPVISGSVFPLSRIAAVELGAEVVDTSGFQEFGEARRSISVKIEGSVPITIDVAKCKNDQSRARTNKFIDTLLGSIES